MSAIALLAGLGAGFLGRRDQERDYARRDKLDQITFDRAARETSEYQQAQTDRKAIRTASAPVPVESGETFQPSVDDDGNAMPANPTVGTYKVGAQRFASEGVAQEVAEDQRRKNISSALIDQGRVGDADQLQASADARKAAALRVRALMDEQEREGTMDAMRMALAGMPAQEIQARYRSSGKDRGIANIQVAPIESVHPLTGQKSKSARMTWTNADGTPGGIEDVEAAMYQWFDAKQRVDLVLKKLDGDRKSAHDNRSLDIAQQNADTTAGYRADQAANMREQRELQERGINAKGVAKRDPLERMPEHEKVEYLGIREQIKTINSEIAKGVVSGALVMEVPKGAEKPEKNAAWKALDSKLAALNMTGKGIMARYGDDGEAVRDPAGIRKPVTKPADRSTTATAADLDRAKIFSDELARVKPADRPALLREIDRLPSALRVQVLERASAAAPAAPTTATPTVAQPTPPMVRPSSLAAQGITVPAARFVPNPDMEQRLAIEMAEMSNPKVNRVGFSPDVDAYYRAKAEGQRQADEATNAARSAAEFAKVKARRAAMGYAAQ